MRTLPASLLALLVAAIAASGTPAATGAPPVTGDDADGRSITYLGVIHDHANLARLHVGTAGFWFPQFDAAEPVDGRPTRERAADALPEWVAPLNHYSVEPVHEVWDQGCEPEEVAAGCVPTFFFRTFSQDGPAHSKGGQPAWSALVLPDGRTGRSGAIVDPHTAGSSNNTVNRIQLIDGVPAVFYVHVLTDNTGGEHDPTGRLRVRGNIGRLDLDLQVDPDPEPGRCDLAFNGVPDIHTFRIEGFQPGDYLKVQLRGDQSGGGASFGGLLFDVAFAPHASSHRAPRGGRPEAC